MKPNLPRIITATLLTAIPFLSTHKYSQLSDIPSQASQQQRYSEIQEKEPSIAEMTFEVEKDFGDIESAENLLEQMVNTAADKLTMLQIWEGVRDYSKLKTTDENTGIAIQALEQINNMLVEYSFNLGSSNLLTEGLEKRQLDCTNTSFIYKEIAETINLPIFLVKAPEHIMVKWDFADGESMYWETTQAIPVSEKEIIEQFNLPKEIVGIIYLRSLSRKEERAVAYTELGVYLNKQGKNKEAEKQFKSALDFDPNCASAQHNLGVLAYEKNDLDTAIYYYNKALKINPSFVNSYLDLATIWAMKGEFEQTSINIEKAKAINENHTDVRIVDIENILRASLPQTIAYSGDMSKEQ